ncbi:YesL family protein [Evansella tamaricis]|uniref:YesL family protein n=1 Tax=Evansella tamaricis TaxID=2069301 RepID=A0ABS6JH16_9BACI|nr:YesL family protein [Evansella tamaricis]MBU9712966.1 YesL family protein [Evansella tamaricis]
MQPSWMSSKFYRTTEWIWRLCYVNLLWLLVTTLGLFFLGVLPATAAMFTIFRKWLRGDTEISIFRTFIESIKKDFLKINLLGLILAFLGYILYFNYQYLGIVEGIQHTVISIGWYTGVFIFSIILLYIFPVYVHFEMKLFQYFKTAFVVGLVNPLALITLIISLGLTGYIFYLVPGLIPFFGASLIGFLVMWAAHLSFERIERKKEKLEESRAKNETVEE